MKTHTTPTGIELLMPQVPRYATNISLQQTKGVGNIKYRLLYRTRIKWTRCRWMYVDSQYKQLSILGTCWYDPRQLPIKEKLVCEGFSPRVLGFTDDEYPGVDIVDLLDLWLVSEGITIDEGFKRVIIKVN